jgi:GTP diphosphokinase / guanosine-3',5'-bis(diphosphate) 3'-diphosphatase
MINKSDDFLKWAKIINSEDELISIFKNQAASLYTQYDYSSLNQCLEYIQMKHLNQLRRGSSDEKQIPYYTHPITVAILAMDYEPTVNTILAALLHDVLEDTPTHLSEVEDKYGNEVAHLVDLLSKEVEGEKKDIDKEYYPKIKANKKARLLKLCDRLANLYSYYHDPNSPKRKRYIKETREKILPMADGFDNLKERIADAIDFHENNLD